MDEAATATVCRSSGSARSVSNSNGSRIQWFSMRGNAGGAPAQPGPDREQRFTLGNGALRFIRTRASVRRESKRFGNRSKSGEKGAACHQPVGAAPQVVSTATSPMEPVGPTGTGFGRWLREHLTVKSGDSNGKLAKHQQQQLSSQNLYCSLPREKPSRRFDHRRASCRISSERHQVGVEDETATRRKSRAAARAERRRHSMSEFQSEQHRTRRNRRFVSSICGMGYLLCSAGGIRVERCGVSWWRYWCRL